MFQNTDDCKFLSAIDIGRGHISRLCQHTVHLCVGCPLSNNFLQSRSKRLLGCEVNGLPQFRVNEAAR